MIRRGRLFITTSIFTLSLLLVGLSPVASAVGMVTVTGTVGVDYATSSQSLSVCSINLSSPNLERLCVAPDQNGGYSMQLDSSSNYYVTLNGAFDDVLVFESNPVQINQPTTDGTLNMTLQTQVITTQPLKDQFGNIIENSEVIFAEQNIPSGFVNNTGFSFTGLNASLVAEQSGTNIAGVEGRVMTDQAGVASIRLPKIYGYDLVFQGPVGTNYHDHSAATSCQLISPSYGGCVPVLRYPTWGTYPDTNTPYSYWTNGQTLTINWKQYPWLAVDHYDLYQGWVEGMPLGQVVTTTSGTSYTNPGPLTEQTYQYTLVARDSQNEIIALAQSMPVTVDRTNPTVSGLSMSKTNINSKTGPVNISLMTAIDNQAIDGSGVEYYVDTDPGAGNGTTMNWFSDAVGYQATTSSLSSLPKGTHTLYARASDMAGNWSDPISINFSKK